MFCSEVITLHLQPVEDVGVTNLFLKFSPLEFITRYTLIIVLSFTSCGIDTRKKPCLSVPVVVSGHPFEAAASSLRHQTRTGSRRNRSPAVLRDNGSSRQKQKHSIYSAHETL